MHIVRILKTSCPTEKPCRFAREDVYTETQIVATVNLKGDEEREKRWFGKGSNHKEVAGMSQRTLTLFCWRLELQSLEDLVDIIEYAHAPVVIIKADENDKYDYEIIIYDEPVSLTL